MVRSSTWCYPSFNLVMDSSSRFASNPWNYAPYSDSLSLRLRYHLTLLQKLTSRLIMQKARRHLSEERLRPLVSVWFQVLLTSLIGELFTVQSPYWSTIGHRVVFSLGGWAPQIHAGFHVSDTTRETFRRCKSFAYRAITVYGLPFQVVRLNLHLVTPCRLRNRQNAPTTPDAHRLTDR